MAVLIKQNGQLKSVGVFRKVSNALQRVALASSEAQPQPTIEPYLTFSSNYTFTLSVYDGVPRWDGTIEYSTDKSTWTVWDGSEISCSGDYKLYLRGTGNTKLSDVNANTTRAWWINAVGSISLSGILDVLLDYQTVVRGEMPPAADNAFRQLFGRSNNGITDVSNLKMPRKTLTVGIYRFMFDGCTRLVNAPALPATNTVARCYQSMFRNCSNLIAVPALYIINPTTQTYGSMFAGCTKIKLSETQVNEYTQPYSVPITRDGISSDGLTNMFTSTGGTFVGTPVINTVYYLSNTNTIVYPEEE